MMRVPIVALVALVVALISFSIRPGEAALLQAELGVAPHSDILSERDHCTAILVGRLASSDGSVMVAHTDDSGPATSDLRLVAVPAAVHRAGSLRPVYNVDGSYPRIVDGARSPAYAPKHGESRSVPIGHVPQVAHTYAYFETDYGLMNERGVSMGESTCGAKSLGPFPAGTPGGTALFGIEELSRIALERCATARCAVMTMGAIATQYGYYTGDREIEDSAEALVVGDGTEGWVFHILPAPDANLALGAIWAAQRLPDDQVTIVANMFIIRQMDLSDTSTFLASANVHEAARSQGWWDGVSPFDFTAAYASLSVNDAAGLSNYYSGRRLWRVFDLVAPSLHLDPALGHINNVSTYPFGVVPEAKVTPQAVMAMLRDHYEGTPYDLTVGVSAGPFGDPNRWSGGPVEAKFQKMGAWERGISIHRTSWSFVCQSFATKPSLVWYGQDTPHSSVYVPFFAAQRRLPYGWDHCLQSAFDRKCSFWAFNFVKNWVGLRYSQMMPDVKEVQAQLETAGFALVASLEKEAARMGLHGKGREAALALLLETAANRHAEHVLEVWWKLSEHLVVKFSNGYITTGEGPRKAIGYPKWWLCESNFFNFPRGNDGSTECPPGDVALIKT